MIRTLNDPSTTECTSILTFMFAFAIITDVASTLLFVIVISFKIICLSYAWNILKNSNKIMPTLKNQVLN